MGQKEKWQFATAKQLYGHYNLQQVAEHRAIILLPYAVLSYGMTELYALDVPIFVPSVPFAVQLGIFYDVRVYVDGSPYCGGVTMENGAIESRMTFKTWAEPYKPGLSF